MSDNKDMSYVFTLSRYYLRLIGIWPDPHIPLREFRRPSLKYIFIASIIVVYVLIPQLINILRVWGNMLLMVENISSVNISVMALSKMIITRYHGETLRKVLISIEADWMTSKKKWERNTMLKVARIGRSLSFKCYVILMVAVIFYIYLYILKFYGNMRLDRFKRKLFHNIPYIYNIHKTPNYVINYILQMMVCISIALVTFLIDVFVSLLLLQICAQLINLRMTLNELVEKLANKSVSSTEFKKGITAIVLRHQELIRNAKIIDDCYSAVLLVHIMAVTFQMCFENFQVYTKVMDKTINGSIIKMSFLVIYVILLLIHLYMYCYAADKLLTESTSIAYSVYESKWYDIPSKDAKDLMFIVYRSVIPLRLTAGKFSTFSIEMFGTTVKTSMGYLSMLLALKG